ncbi:hypothetical protein J1N35_025038 [Gossypium stocksii]|uniref:Uncharacterized protein n=1 Tax=Gossypium stocksii TaxID=47602 RepID=A0A9D3V682_9ROSI|nr:hypothetical protein J1N35_025038 [Gossypium stocksii]
MRCRDEFIPDFNLISFVDVYISLYNFRGSSILSILSPHADVNANVNVDTDADTCTNIDSDIDVVINASIDAWVNVDVFQFCDIVHYSPIVSQTPTASSFYRCSLSAQLFSHRVENTRWEIRTTPHSSTDKRDGNENEGKGGDEDEDDGEDEDEYEGRGEGEDEKDEDDDHMIKRRS